ncbi:MAG: SpoIVB peptidase S55 domain-containing protein, partial [Succiniclasticum sp.]
GYAKTVISGDTIETFPVEVLGVTGSDSMGYQILIRAGGDVMERSGGIAQGMSGSPVYIDGRLAGAIAYGTAFTDPHYCLLTPIQDMLDILDKPEPHRAAATAPLLPKGTPLMAGGFSPAGISALQEGLQPYGLTVADTGASGTSSSSKDLEPGSSVGAALIQGDLTLGALGTVTWTDELGRILAFGHPFMKRGDAEFFLTKTWVLASLPNLQSAYKIGNIGAAAGMFSQDRNAGIAGQIGRLPAYIPLYVSVSDATRSRNGSARVKIVNDDQLAPKLAASVLTSQAAKIADHGAGGSARILFDITAQDSKGELLHISRENMFFDNTALMKQLPAELQETVQVLLQNKLEKVRITNIDVNVDASTESLIAEIKKVAVQEKEPKPGDTIHLKVTLKPYRGQEFVRTVGYKLPKDAAGEVRLNVRGGASMAWLQELLRKQKEKGEPKAKKDERKKDIKLSDYVREVNQADRNNDIIIEYAPDQKRQASRKEEEGEASLASMLAGGRNKQSVAIDYIVDGEQKVTVKLP